MAGFKFTPEEKKYAEAEIRKQPAYTSKAEALIELRKRYEQGDIRQLWQEPNGGKYIVAEDEVWEDLGNLGYKQVYDLPDVYRMMSTDDIKEV